MLVITVHPIKPLIGGVKDGAGGGSLVAGGRIQNPLHCHQNYAKVSILLLPLDFNFNL